MQLALQSGPTNVACRSSYTPSATRRNKFIIGGVAALSASVIAVTPVANTSVALEIQQRAVHLVAEVTDSPAAVYGDLFNNTANNIGTLVQQYSARPFPILNAVLSNQVGYFNRIIGSFGTASTALGTWWETGTRESPPGKTLLANVQAALASGNFNAAYDNFNKLALFGIQNTILPILNGSLFSTATVAGIPQQIAQNVTDVIGAIFTTGTLVFGAFQSIYAPISGAAFELSRALGAVATAATSGNLVGALNALVNTPGVVANAFLNGFDYNEGDTTEAWAGLFSPKGTRASGGPISQFLITIAQKIATAIANVPAVTTTAVTTTAASTAGIATANLLSLAPVDSATTETTSTETAGTETAAAKTADTTGASTEATTGEVASGAATTVAADEVTAPVAVEAASTSSAETAAAKTEAATPAKTDEADATVKTSVSTTDEADPTVKTKVSTSKSASKSDEKSSDSASAPKEKSSASASKSDEKSSSDSASKSSATASKGSEKSAGSASTGAKSGSGSSDGSKSSAGSSGGDE